MSKLRILLVEDDVIVRMDLEAFIRDLGMEVVASCSTGEQAIEIATQTNPDLILMDIILHGELDGMDTAQLIAMNRRVPVIYLTGFCNELMVQRAKMTGPSGYLLKPFDRQILRRTLENAVAQSKSSLNPEPETTALFDPGSGDTTFLSVA